MTKLPPVARATRREIVDAAGRLFAEHGYVGTTMEAIAREANVAVQTVYAAFANKRAIVEAVAARGRLRTGMTTGQAAQTGWALSSSDVLQATLLA